jgi:hypothetical protein
LTHAWGSCDNDISQTFVTALAKDFGGLGVVFSGSGCLGEGSTQGHGIQKESMRIGKEKGWRLDKG